MAALSAKLAVYSFKRPLMIYFAFVLLFLVSLIYTKSATTSFTVDGHKFALAAVSGITIDGKLYYLPVYKEVSK